MNNTTTETGTTLEVLAPYLPYGIEVEMLWYPLDEDRHKLLGIDGRSNQPLLLGYGKSCGLGSCLPVLKPFSALCDPLPDGTVPIKRVIELELNLTCDPARHIKIGSATEAIFFNEHGEAWKVLYWADWLAVGNMNLATADYLRSKHFAVGLEPHQFVSAPSQGQQTPQTPPLSPVA